MAVQDLIFGVVNMLHMLSYGHQGVWGGGGGVLAFLTSNAIMLRNMLPLLTCCTTLSYVHQGGWGGGWGINVPDE